MVTVQKKSQSALLQIYEQKPFNWVSLPVKKLFDTGLRLEAGVYATDAEKAKQAIFNCKFGTVELKELAVVNYYTRFKRVFVAKSAYPVYQPSQIKEIRPLPAAYVSDKTNKDIEQLRVRKGQILMTRSGTVGKVTYVSETLNGNIFSDDLLRINAKDKNDIGYLYVFFLSDIGHSVVQSNNYGAVIQHIEPAHLLGISVPDAPRMLKWKINSLVKESFALRDESNALINKSHEMLKSALSLPPVESFLDKDNHKPWCFSIRSSDLKERFEAKFYHPVVQAILMHLEKHAVGLTTLGDKKLVREILLPGIFKRYYVEPEYGVPYIDGKDILSLDPRGGKYLSITQHKKLITDKLSLLENMLLVTCSGTIGKIALVPKHWQGWVASNHMLRILPNDNFEGYLYAWLSSEWALPLIQRYAYGAVISEINQHHIAGVEVPLLNESLMNEINHIVLEANRLRYLAFEKEQEAVNIFNTQIM
ncbi:restriction endonuclease subunit S [Escherichia coli]